MKGTPQLFLLPALIFLLPVGHHAAAQEDFHEFANKDGVKIEAKIVSVTTDWKTMKILMRDGRDFDMAVNVLRLDDQQIVKNWIEANPGGAGPKIDYNLEVEIEKKAKTVKNERGSFYKTKTMAVSYEIAVKNRSRQDLVGARVDYVVILEDKVKVYQDSNGLLDYLSDSDGEKSYLRKSEPLEETLPFNHDHTFLTEAVDFHQMFGDGNVSYNEDKMLGVILRVIGANEEVIGEYRSNEAHVQRVTWDQVKGDGFDADSTGTPAAPVSGVPEMSSTSGLPEWLEVNELTEWPESLSKGDTVPASVVPRSGGKTIRLSALIDVDEENSDGVIVSSGGQGKGFALFVHDGALQFRSKRLNEEMIGVDRTIQVPLSDLPDDEFKVSAVYDATSLKLWINDELKAEGESAGLLHTRPKEGLSVGYDSEESAVGPVAPPHAFRGGIREVGVQFIDQ